MDNEADDAGGASSGGSLYRCMFTGNSGIYQGAPRASAAWHYQVAATRFAARRSSA
jgi:hypothetical protein